MNHRALRQTALAAAIGLMFTPVFASGETGKRIDNARVDLHQTPPPAELQPNIHFPLPSGVTRTDVTAMKSAVAALPATLPAMKKSFEDSSRGALFASGKADLTAAYHRHLDELASRLRGKDNLKISVTGHTDNQRLSAATQNIYRDNQGLSEARALAVAAHLKNTLNLSAGQLAIEGFGSHRPVAGNDTAEGMAQNRRVEIHVWFDEIQAAPALPPQPPLVAQPRSPCAPEIAGAPQAPFRITIDGEPVSLADAASEADRQRCTDVALEKADIQVRFDALAINPAMNAWAYPNGVVRGESVEFRAWSNYIPWIAKAELRLFRPGQQPVETPLAILPIDWSETINWPAPAAGADDKVFYLLRVYDADGRFDETGLKPLELLVRPRPAEGFADQDKIERERLAGFGENSLQLRNIPVKGGTVTINGSRLVPGQTVRSLGLAMPVDAHGKFAIKQILPAGPHTVEVKVTNPDGSATTFRRNLTIAADDWFYVALGDLTIGRNRVSGPAALVTGDTQHYDGSTYIDGRGAFYLKGKIKGEYLLTASADTREQPIENLFKNFSSKDPRYLLRSIDPNAYYPVYGDDSTTVDDAPTQGKFYVRLEKGDSHVMWGNFQTAWSGTELLQYSRGLYGAKARYRSEDTTRFGEKRTVLDAFAADPGTVAARDEFRGSGGSLYYLRQQDITQGSERVWIEVRDKDSGLVIERKQLVPAQDYEINYLQGRLILNQPLAMSGSAASLVMTSAVGGNPLYLVTTYEHVPGLTAVSNLTSGIRASHWLGDHWQLGLTHYRQGEANFGQSLRGADLTARYKPGTWVKFEVARSEGVGTPSQVSQDGGFGFNPLASGGQAANAYRVEAATDLAEVTESMKGRVSAYVQDKERGFSAPGQITFGGEAMKQQGLRADVQVAEGTTLLAKADSRDGDIQDSKATEVGLRQKLNSEWTGAVGLRRDERQNVFANASPTLSQNGGRSDLILRGEYRPDKMDGKPGEKEDWETYGFVQGTLAKDGDRQDNHRGGVGGAWRINDRFKLLAEISEGSLGTGGKLGGDYRLSDRSNAYLTYVVETETPDVAWRGRQGTWVSGTSTRVSDQLRVFGEARATHGAGPESLSQAFGLDWAANDRWTYGVKGEIGELSDPFAGDMERRAIGLSASYKFEKVKYSGNLEWRGEDGNITGKRDTWLVRNTFGYQVSRDWRLLGKLNWSHSNNSRGTFYDGAYHEVVAAAAWRPVDNDRWNTLFKYTNLYNLPAPGQVGASGSVADYAQRSQVLAVDTIYDLKPWLSVGGKYAMRFGELKTSKVDGEWFDSRADLLILRADFHWVKEWDALLELRKLRATEAQDARAGWLVGVYRHVGEGVKMGIGYNFTNYTDDLTDLSYRSRGWFLNVLGTF
jgi:outer membrane protein OmpA-like peptidoglycan-associated protein